MLLLPLALVIVSLVIIILAFTANKENISNENIVSLTATPISERQKSLVDISVPAGYEISQKVLTDNNFKEFSCASDGVLKKYSVTDKNGNSIDLNICRLDEGISLDNWISTYFSMKSMSSTNQMTTSRFEQVGKSWATKENGKEILSEVYLVNNYVVLIVKKNVGVTWTTSEIASTDKMLSFIKLSII